MKNPKEPVNPAASPFGRRDGVTMPVSNDDDIRVARDNSRRLARELGFSTSDQALVASVVSGLARDVLQAGDGSSLVIRPLRKDGIVGIELAAEHTAWHAVPTEAQSFRVRQVVDEFVVRPGPDGGMTVVLTKWNSPGGGTAVTVGEWNGQGRDRTADTRIFRSAG